MTIVTVDDLHTSKDPEKRLKIAASIARAQAGNPHSRLIVRVPDRQTNGVRAYRLDDVARMLQRHGRILEIGVTDGGTIVAAGDVVTRRGEVAIWTGQAIGPWAPSDIVQRGLGGSETAAVRLAEQLDLMGYATSLYGHFENPGLAGGILLRHYAAFDASEPLDALVGFRDARLFDQRPTGPKTTILWLEDLAPAEGLTPRNAANIDRIVAVSAWHRQQCLDAHPWLDPAKVVAGRNGIVNSWFDEEPAPERECRVVYSSSPDRGGDVLLELWPEVREQVPDAELVLTYSRWIDLVANVFQQAHDHMARIRELLEQPGVSRIEGGIGQKQLATLLRSSKVWAHPSWYTAGGRGFEETSCIASLEAQAAGCVVVAAKRGALQESVMYGTLIDGDATDPEWRKHFVSAIVQGLTDETTQLAAQECGPQMMRDMGWRGAAEQLAAMFPVRSHGYGEIAR